MFEASGRASRLYALLLYVYPLRFRERFGEEMICVFEQQAEAARDQGGSRALWRVWRTVGLEILDIGLRARLDALRVPAISVLLAFLFIAAALVVIAPLCLPK